MTSQIWSCFGMLFCHGWSDSATGISNKRMSRGLSSKNKSTFWKEWITSNSSVKDGFKTLIFKRGSTRVIMCETDHEDSLSTYICWYKWCCWNLELRSQVYQQVFFIQQRLDLFEPTKTLRMMVYRPLVWKEIIFQHEALFWTVQEIRKIVQV